MDPPYGVSHKPEKVWTQNALLKKNGGQNGPKTLGHFSNLEQNEKFGAEREAEREILEQNEEIGSRTRNLGAQREIWEQNEHFLRKRLIKKCQFSV